MHYINNDNSSTIERAELSISNAPHRSSPEEPLASKQINLLKESDSNKSTLCAMNTSLEEQLPHTLLEEFPEEISIPVSISGIQPKESFKVDPISALQNCLAQHCPEQERDGAEFFNKKKI